MGKVLHQGVGFPACEAETSFRSHLAKTKLCAHFYRGTCLFGSRCAFAHTANELKKAPNLRKTRMCEAFLKGHCNQVDCKFAHGEGDLTKAELFHKTTMCVWYEKGKCRYGASCRFAHGANEVRAPEPQQRVQVKLFSSPGNMTPTESMASEIMDSCDRSTTGSLQEEFPTSDTGPAYMAPPVMAPSTPPGFHYPPALLAAPGLAGHQGPSAPLGFSKAGSYSPPEGRMEPPPSPWGSVGAPRPGPQLAVAPVNFAQMPMKVHSSLA